jgi:hypothetical protein
MDHRPGRRACDHSVDREGDTDLKPRERPPARDRCHGRHHPLMQIPCAGPSLLSLPPERSVILIAASA